MVSFRTIIASMALTSLVAAHPGHDPREEALERRSYYDSVPPIKRSLNHREAKIKARGLEQRSLARREALATNARQKRGLANQRAEKRDAASVLNTTHLSNDTSINMDVTEDYLFGNGSCILVPEVTQGPYYVEGEYIRKNITEDQEGIPLTLEIQVIDVNTCEPVPDVYIDFWHCNATGVYSAIVANGNGDSSDTANVNTTFLRGIAETDTEGVATFESIVPGHYTSRANHVHIITHTKTTLYVNGTMSPGSIQHVGQLFFDMSLLKQVEATYPYNTNTQDWTTNAEDSSLAEETATDGVDPVVEYILLGEDISDGVLAWISMGVDMTNNQTVSPAGNYYRTGGVMDESSGGMGSGMGGGAGNGTANGTASAPPS
ncbi:aromatic compound dioxygenase [Aureobasidium melanogenum CBS 110374]|uniref:Aromatic compound dioxygenase n=1 Tax=Aureobasidium melanogenum (strain CBS 110374) TaxID=1043003 RepID=A0A074WJS7_AURM1|nr:aromatic compound dioxygenase [Aureobasidium melanogenum CBS 110374]KEQ62636.1 aromatic compound dioxygenase [Aureobasidium melanogenum CBS 110374]